MKGEWQGGKGSGNRVSNFGEYFSNYDKIYARKTPKEWAELLGHKIQMENHKNLDTKIKYAEYLQMFLIDDNG